MFGKEKTIVYKDRNNFYIYFNETDRYYKIDENKKIEEKNDIEKVTDTNPGDYTKDENGNTLLGNEEEPYQINCIEDLCALSNSPSTRYVKVMKDLDFESDFSYVNGSITKIGKIPSFESADQLKEYLTNESGNGFVPISQVKNFDGNNKRIDNIYINCSTVSGLFSMVQGDSSISNVIISGDMKSDSTVGGIIGFAWGNGTTYITNCHNYCNITSTLTKNDVSDMAVGGIVGVTKKTTVINKCSNLGSIGADVGSAGGIIGINIGGGSVKNCYNTGNIYGGAYSGGIIGGRVSIAINCYNLGEISKGNKGVGGITGYVYWQYTELYNCYNAGEIKGNESRQGSIFGTHNISGSLLLTSNLFALNNVKNQTALNTSRVTAYSEEQLHSKEFVDTLNNFIKNNTENIDTIGYYKWKYNENSYPTIDDTIYWDGSEWIDN